MTRPTFTPVYEEGETTVRDRMLGRIDPKWRKEPGDFPYDMVVTSPPEVKQLQANQDSILQHAFPQFAEDEYLDYKLVEVGLERNKATPNERSLNITADAGVVIPEGYGLTTLILDGDGNPLEYTANAALTFSVAGTLALAITCTQVGAGTNAPDGSEFMLTPPIPGVRAIVDAGTTTPGADKESDDDAYARYLFKIQHPDTGGNKNDYVRWATEYKDADGNGLVGAAKCLPRWNGNGTVKVILAGLDKTPATQDVVDELQAYIDPGSAGLGDGKAPCGAAVTVVAATALAIDIAANVQYYAGADVEAVRAAFNTAVTAYLKGVAFVEIAGDPDRNNVPVVIAKIGSILIGTEGVANYSGLTLNGETVDVPVTTEQVATLGVVTI